MKLLHNGQKGGMMSYSMLYESPVQNLELISDGEGTYTRTL